MEAPMAQADRSLSPKRDLYQDVTARILAELERKSKRPVECWDRIDWPRISQWLRLTQVYHQKRSKEYAGTTWRSSRSQGERLRRKCIARGLKVHYFSAKDLTRLAEAELERNYAELIAAALEVINTSSDFAQWSIPWRL
jgi:hypothetical protein